MVLPLTSLLASGNNVSLAYKTLNNNGKSVMKMGVADS